MEIIIGLPKLSRGLVFLVTVLTRRIHGSESESDELVSVCANWAGWLADYGED